jgi:hypothetical protein
VKRIILLIFLSLLFQNSGASGFLKPLIDLLKGTAPQVLVKSGKITRAGITKKVQKILKKYGPKSNSFMRTHGYKSLDVLESISKNSGNKIISFSSKYGAKAWPIINNPNKQKLFLKHGEIAGKAMIKHPGISSKAIDRYGISSAAALNRLNMQDAIRYGKLFLKTAKYVKYAVRINKIIEQYGKPAMDFIWENRVILGSSAAAMATFLNEPDRYIH